MKLRMVLVCAAVFAVAIAGCESLTAPESDELTDQDLAALKELILSDPLYTNDPAMLNDGDDPSRSYAALGITATPIIPIAWGRNITNVGRDVTFERLNDTTLIATLTHTLEGTVFIVAKYPTDDTARTVVRKPLTEVTVRKIKLERVAPLAARSDSGRKGFRPAEVSATKGGTTNAQATITKMEVNVGSETIVITDPTEYFMKIHPEGRGGRPPVFTTGPRENITVRVTLTSAEPDTEWVSIHRPLALMAGRPEGIRPAHARMTLVSQTQTGSTYERVFETSWESVVQGRLAFFVTALTHNSLYDDQAAFSSQIWGVPYIAR
ncbi:MAG: hypothetical protein ACRDGA_10660 [Bacteroidota bacterium]